MVSFEIRQVNDLGKLEIEVVGAVASDGERLAAEAMLAAVGVPWDDGGRRCFVRLATAGGGKDGRG